MKCRTISSEDMNLLILLDQDPVKFKADVFSCLEEAESEALIIAKAIVGEKVDDPDAVEAAKTIKAYNKQQPRGS